MQRIRGDLTPAIDQVKALINDLDRELGRMPSFKVGTPWHTDRVRAREGLASRLDRLQAEQRTIAQSN